jgi:hypothetical protein
MQHARSHHTATLLLDGTVLVAGGAPAWLSGPALETAEIYDPKTDSWSATSSMQTGREFHTATRLADGRVLVLGGQGQTSSWGIPDQLPLASAEIFDHHRGTWSMAKPLPHAHIGQTATLLRSGNVLVAGGSDAHADLYDPITDTWSSAGSVPMPLTRPGQTATLLTDGRVLLAPGFTGDDMPSAPTAVYNPSTNSWAAAAPMTWGETWATAATPLPDGDVLLVGESVSRVGVATAEVFTPSRNAWRAALTDTPFTRYNFWTALTLPSGQGLGLGGNLPDPGTPAGKIYDPATGTWLAASPLAHPRLLGFSATLLANGRVLIAGGQGPYSTSKPMAEAEQYSP